MNFNYVGDDPNFFNTITTPVAPPNFTGWNRQGWICPKCGRVYSPDTIMCNYCGGNANITPITVGDKTFPDDWLIYHVTDPLKEPEVHLDKDWKNKEFFVDYNNPNVSY